MEWHIDILTNRSQLLEMLLLRNIDKLWVIVLFFVADILLHNAYVMGDGVRTS